MSQGDKMGMSQSGGTNGALLELRGVSRYYGKGARGSSPCKTSASRFTQANSSACWGLRAAASLRCCV